MLTKVKLLCVMLSILTINNMWAQNRLSTSDSLLWQHVKSDTAQLRALTATRNGEIIAAKAHLKLAQTYFNAKDDNRALVDFMRIYVNYQLLPEAKKAALYLGKIAFHKNDLATSSKYLGEYLASNPEGKDAEWANYHLLKINGKNQDTAYVSKAQTFLSNNANLTRKISVPLHRDLILKHFNNKNYKQTKAEAEKFIAKYPDDSLRPFIQYYLMRSMFLLNDSNFVNAAKSFLAANYSGDTKINSEIQYNLMRYYLNKHDYSLGLSEASLMLRYFPNDSLSDMTKYYIARAKYVTNDSDYTFSARDFLSINKKHLKKLKPVVQYELMRNLMNSGSFNSALTEARAMTTLYPKDSLAVEAKFLIGELYTLLDHNEEAIIYYKSLRDSLVNNRTLSARVLFLLSEVYSSKHDFENARKGFNSVLTTYPEAAYYSTASRYALANIAYAEGLQQQSNMHPIPGYNEMKQFIADFPTDRHIPRALRTFAEMAIKDGNYQEAVDACDKIIKYDTLQFLNGKKKNQVKNDYKFHRQLMISALTVKARILRENMQKPGDALTIYTELICKDQSNGDLLLNKALCLRDLNRTPEAIEILDALNTAGNPFQETAAYYLNELR